MAKWYIGMSEDAIRQRVADTALSLLGIRENTIDHKERIVDVYNSLDKLPRGYRLKEDDAWCAAFITVIGILLGISHIILPECGCGPMIELYKAQGRWMEADDYIPKPGDICMLDWDAQRGECVGSPDHVGLVEWVKGKEKATTTIRSSGAPSVWSTSRPGASVCPTMRRWYNPLRMCLRMRGTRMM